MKQTFLEKPPIATDDQVDHLEHMLRNKYSLKTGFAESHAVARTFHQQLRAMDFTDDESMDLAKFRVMMKKLNCGENQAAVDALFHRYDSKDTGRLTMKGFADGLFGLSKVPQSNAECRNVIKAVRKVLLTRGENGFRGLVRILRRMDDNGNRKLEKHELKEGLMVYGLEFSKQEWDTLFHFFDRNGDGHIDITEFIVGLRPTISPARVALVKLAFLRLDRKNPDGRVTLQELGELYKADKHPQVLDGTKTEAEIIADFNNAWDKNGDEVITEDEFIEYYKDLSASIDNDQYFELMIRNAWHMAGGTGAAANTSNLRVLVTHMDGSQSVETILNDLGLPDKKSDTLAAALRKQGVTDILKVETAY